MVCYLNIAVIKLEEVMKNKILYLLFIVPALQGCVANNQGDEVTTGWLFWVFLGLLLGILFIGALVNLLRKKKPEGTPTKAEKQIEAYEETLEHKIEEESHQKSDDDIKSS